MHGEGAPAGGSKATVHGTCDYLLGGCQHLKADRELGQAIEERFPAVRVHLRATAQFHLRAARWCAGRGISRFVATGAASWKAGLRNVHDTVPGATVVYADGDLEGTRWARAILGRGVSAVRVSPSDPRALLSAAPVAALLAGKEPACLILGMRFQFMPAEAAQAYTELCAAALAPGSALVLSLALVGDSPETGELLRMFTPAPVYRHTAEDVAGWLKGAGLDIAGPGVDDVRRLLRDGVRALGEPLRVSAGVTAGAIALAP